MGKINHDVSGLKDSSPAENLDQEKGENGQKVVFDKFVLLTVTGLLTFNF